MTVKVIRAEPDESFESALFAAIAERPSNTFRWTSRNAMAQIMAVDQTGKVG